MELENILNMKSFNYNVRIRKENRTSAINKFRQNLVISTFGFNPLRVEEEKQQQLSEDSWNIDNIEDSIEKILREVVGGMKEETTFEGLDIIEKLKMVFIKLKEENSERARRLQNKILILLSFLPSKGIVFHHIINKLSIVQFMIDIFENNQNSRRAATNLLIQLSTIPEVKKQFISSQKFIRVLLNFTETTTKQLNQKNTPQVIKLLLTWWVDFQPQNYKSFFSIYKLANEVILNYSYYLYNSSGTVDESAIKNSLIIIEKYFKKLRDFGTFEFDPICYIEIMRSQNIQQSKRFVMIIMVLMMKESSQICQKMSDNYFLILAESLCFENRKIIFLSFYYYMLSCKCSSNMFPYLYQMFYCTNFMNVDAEDKSILWNIVELWFQQKQKMDAQDCELLLVLANFKEPLNEEKEIMFWNKVVSRGYDRQVPDYVYYHESE